MILNWIGLVLVVCLVVGGLELAEWVDARRNAR